MKLNVGKPVTGNELIGRKNEVEIIIKTLMSGQSVALIAPRRFGKTSIMLEVIKKLNRKGYYTGMVDIFTIPDIHQLALQITSEVLSNKKLDKVFKKVVTNISELLRNIRLKNEIMDAEFILSFAGKEVNNWEQIANSLDYIDRFAIKNNKEFCFGFDEFGDIKKLDGNDITKLFRAKIQKQENSIYLFSGSYESVMNELFVTRKSPFYRLVRIIEPGFLEIKEAKSLIKKTFNRYDLSYNEDIVHEGVSFTKGHPYYLRLFMQEYIFIEENSGMTLSIKEIINNMFTTEKNYIESVWDDLSSSKELKYSILKVIETNGNPYTGPTDHRFNLSRGLNQLKGMGQLFKEKNGYTLTDPLVEYFIKTRVLRMSFQL